MPWPREEKYFDVSNTKEAFFTGHVPNDRKYDFLSNNIFNKLHLFWDILYFKRSWLPAHSKSIYPIYMCVFSLSFFFSLSPLPISPPPLSLFSLSLSVSPLPFSLLSLSLSLSLCIYIYIYESKSWQGIQQYGETFHFYSYCILLYIHRCPVNTCLTIRKSRWKFIKTEIF